MWNMAADMDEEGAVAPAVAQAAMTREERHAGAQPWPADSAPASKIGQNWPRRNAVHARPPEVFLFLCLAPRVGLRRRCGIGGEPPADARPCMKMWLRPFTISTACTA